MYFLNFKTIQRKKQKNICYLVIQNISYLVFKLQIYNKRPRLF